MDIVYEDSITSELGLWVVRLQLCRVGIKLTFVNTPTPATLFDHYCSLNSDE